MTIKLIAIKRLASGAKCMIGPMNSGLDPVQYKTAMNSEATHTLVKAQLAIY